MSCDTRSIISDGTTLYADPFAEPISCGCHAEHSIRPWLQCETHGCCMKKTKMEWCPEIDSCSEVIELHRYVQARRRLRNIWGASRGSVWSLPIVPSKDEDWRYVRELDDCLFAAGMPYTTASEPVFSEALHNLVCAGRLIVDTQAQLNGLYNCIDKKREMHDYFHGEACERVLNEWECAARGPIESCEALARQMGKALMKQMEVFEAAWRLIQTIMWNEMVDEELIVDELEIVMDE
ncbi:hypothetical protein NW762_009960 [Fusarium torreyae]|uniref:Uncharacterized protein n=1 Tax=Fusarium torreyae TaxID=1237075 RepID=A0A9W8RV82_9HYPO|nr:hypothetical protein NW762_009960 [Fusarium torreyae]